MERHPRFVAPIIVDLLARARSNAGMDGKETDWESL
jgi:hypothetical protein